MSLLAALGRCSYGGVNLNSPEFLTLGITHNVVSDPAGRTTSYVQTTIRIKTVIYSTPPTTTESTIEALTTTLTTQGLAFIYDTKGGGSIHANVAGEDGQDVCYGPKPKVVQLTIKGPYAWELVWEVTVCLQYCAEVDDTRPMEINFGLNFAIDLAGYTTRRYRGHLRIASRRQVADRRRIARSADDYRDQIWADVPTGFRRTRSDFTLSDDKTRLEFAIDDEQMPPTYPPPGVVRVNAEESRTNGLSSGGAFGVGVWNGSLSATYELQDGTAATVALNHFAKLYNSRRAQLAADPAVKRGDISKRDTAYHGTVIITGVSIAEPDIYDRRRCRFSVNYMVTSVLHKWLAAGLWTAPPDSDWKAWKQSMSWGGGKKPERAIAQMAFKADSDRITDACDTAQPKTAKPPTSSSLTGKGATLNTIGAVTGGGVISVLSGQVSVVNTAPPATGSWLYWRNALYLEQQDGTVMHTPLLLDDARLESAKASALGGVAAAGMRNPFAGTGGYEPNTGFINVPDSIIQFPRAPVYFVHMTGMAIRVGYEIDEPVLLSVGDRQTFPANQPSAGHGFAQRQLWEFFGLPVYVAQWKHRYALLGEPNRVDTPLHAFVGGGATSTLTTLGR